MNRPVVLGTPAAAALFLFGASGDDPGSGAWFEIGQKFGPGGQMIALWGFFVTLVWLIEKIDSRLS